MKSIKMARTRNFLFCVRAILVLVRQGGEEDVVHHEGGGLHLANEVQNFILASLNAVVLTGKVPHLPSGGQGLFHHICRVVDSVAAEDAQGGEQRGLGEEELQCVSIVLNQSATVQVPGIEFPTEEERDGQIDPP